MGMFVQQVYSHLEIHISNGRMWVWDTYTRPDWVGIIDNPCWCIGDLVLKRIEEQYSSKSQFRWHRCSQPPEVSETLHQKCEAQPTTRFIFSVQISFPPQLLGVKEIEWDKFFGHLPQFNDLSQVTIVIEGGSGPNLHAREVRRFGEGLRATAREFSLRKVSLKTFADDQELSWESLVRPFVNSWEHALQSIPW